MYPKKINKEEISRLHFPAEEVLTSKELQSKRERELMNGLILGNTEKGKCRIVFHSTEGDSYVETTIKAVTDKYICLKGGITLLVSSIIEVIF
jgi:hypothetical protein